MTQEEKRAIATLKRLAAKWPRSLWLFSAAGRLCVMRSGPDGRPVTLPSGSVDDKMVVCTINIPNDGGDW
jgi:hypothetical protein